MLDFNLTEMAVVAVVALLVIGPKDLPKALRVAGYWIGKARGVARQFRAGFDEMVREAELAEMEKKWQEENERIMREHSAPATATAALAAPVPADDPAPVEPGTTAMDDDQPPLPLMVEQPLVRPAADASPSRESGPEHSDKPSHGAAS
ncbi:Sec-independent protein translocase protein TatB [Sphingomonas sp. SUN019]|uniref:Sec-independent protein translocase protein TatB n=1 Tax=Sphingomonas sp. SUN019 TaxID=2937788 RepID=UPI002164C22D|nr:Sec-independent protein translocase protein TatB [Sphingomonas sp. SUN019]UVO51635.1 Sec-independent protein translocase protein TatB [Sphingomonas sp. SUN019]